MTGWLEPLVDHLDRRSEPATFFFRDDDAGWADERLLMLCDRFRGRAIVDVAAIPCEVTRDLGHALMRRTGHVAVHQHGFAHRNHNRSGKKCEFGPLREPAHVARELNIGRAMLRDIFGDRLEPIFTPPWNRCSIDTVRLLGELGFEALSMDRRLTSASPTTLVELPIAVDWVRRREDLATALVDACAADPVGVMLHHEVMDHGDLDRLTELLELLDGHPRASITSMGGLLRQGDRQ